MTRPSAWRVKTAMVTAPVIRPGQTCRRCTASITTATMTSSIRVDNG